MTADEEAILPTARWPLIALGLVVVLSFGMLAVDVAVARATADHTSDLVRNAMRSVALAGDLRAHAQTLASPTLAHGELDAVTSALQRDAARYDPLATYPGEREEWNRLQRLLADLRTQRAAGAVDRSGLYDIEASIDRIVDLNQHEADDALTAIADAHHENLVIDAAAGGITLVLAAIVAGALMRSLWHRRQLMQARLALIDERQRELEAFAGRVAHDLRGPLQPIRGYADLLVAGDGPAPAVLGARLARSSERLAAIVDELLELSLSGHARPGTAEVAPVVADVVDEMKPVLGDARVELAVAPCTTGCSSAALEQILHNLVSNAAKYRSPERLLVVAISAAPANDAIEIVVADNGVGMDTPTATHAFDPLYRASTARKIPGHGLGLSIVKRTVDALGGSCAIESQPGVGTRFVVRLPAAVGQSNTTVLPA